MATVIGSLRVLLGLDSAKFSSGVKTARRDLNAFSSSSLGVSASIAALGGRMIAFGGAAATSLIAFSQFRKSFEDLDRLQETSRELGISSQSLRGLEFAAAKANVTADELTAAMRKLGSGIGEAGSDGGEFGKTLKQLGLDAESLVKVPLDEQLRQVADALASIGNVNQRLGLAANIFGLRRLGILRVLAGGRGEINKAIEEANRAGGVFSERDLAKVNEADDSFKRLKFSLKSFADEIVVTVSPALTKLFDSISKNIERFRFFGSIIGQVIAPEETLEQLTTGLARAMDELAKEQAVAGNLMEMGVKVDLTRIQQLQGDVDSLQKRIDKLNAASEPLGTIGDTTSTLGERVGRFGASTAAELGIDPNRPLFGGGGGSGAFSNQVPSNIKKMTNQLDTLIELTRLAVRGPTGQGLVLVD